MRVLIGGALMAVLHGCSGSPQDLLLPPTVGLEPRQVTERASSRLTVYDIDGEVPRDELTHFPAPSQGDKGWRVRPWGPATSPDETRDLVRFLSGEAGKYLSESPERHLLAQIAARMDRETAEGDLFAYRYQYIGPPGSGHYSWDVHWLYFYWLDFDASQVIEVTNAFR